jgi:hypothetical protein
MAWHWNKSIPLFGGLRTNLSLNGIGWSWGLGFIRFGVSPSGRKWVSFGIPGTGFRYYKYLNSPESFEATCDFVNVTQTNENPLSPKPITKWKNLK